jgi:hypothetical protein
MVGEDQRALEALKELAALKEHVWNTKIEKVCLSNV